ncbi:MAG: hypothetical protein QNI93_15070 [Kiloniellales bacterium]|nr:hypothetical protein [Kiloniellales bacterium]
MNLGKLLAAENLIQPADLDRAVAWQESSGGDLAQYLLEIGAIDRRQLDAVLSRQPRRPQSIEETGLSLSFLTGLVLKSMYLNGSDCASALVEELKLSPRIVQGLVDYVRKRQFIEPLGSSASTEHPLDVHFTLSESGRARAVEAIEQSEYVGPAPVPLPAFEAQVLKQSLTQEQVDSEMLSESLSDLLVPNALADRMGTALNSGHPILMYGPPGNGKSSISRAIGRCFRQLIYLPRCIEVDGQVIKVFDPTVHEAVVSEDDHGATAGTCTVRQSVNDPRWVHCRRPFLWTGVELTLDMLDLNFHQRAHFYDAPLQMKASGGVLFVDDFGRQLLRPIDILNRWIVPLEHGADYLTLETGRKFGYTFDVALIFSTNLTLENVMDADIMRRIPYRIRIEAPSRDEFVLLLERECAGQNIDLPTDLRSYLLDELYASKGRPFARYHPRFIVEHAIANAKYKGCSPRIDREVLAEAMQDLFTE